MKIPTITGILAALAMTAPAAATLPVPSEAAAPRDAQAFLFKAGAGDIFEIVSSQMAVQHAASPQVRAFATMLIDHHTNTTNNALAAAKASQIMAPPPELSPIQKDMVSQLMAASPDAFDRIYLQQQLPAHEQALALMQGYARGGDTPALRAAAQGAIPIILSHIAQARQLLASTR